MLTVMVAALNEEELIAKTLSNIVMSARAVGLTEYELLVVNDGSTDKTGEILANLQQSLPFLKVITHDKPHGFGASFVEAVHCAKYDKITCFAGDNNSHWSLMEAIFANRDKADMLTSYFINTEVRKRARNLLSTIFSTIYVTTFDLNVKYINGNPLYSVPMLRKMKIRAHAHSIFAEINTRLLRQNITFYEVAGWSNPDTNRSQSIGFRNFWEVVKCYVALVVEVYITNRSQYKARARRVGMPVLNAMKTDPNIHFNEFQKLVKRREDSSFKAESYIDR